MNFGHIVSGGNKFIAAEAFVPTPGNPSQPRLGILALRLGSLDEMKARGDNVRIVQLQLVILPGMGLTRHVFQGLQRPLLCEGDINGSEKKLVYCRKPSFDGTAFVGADGFEAKRIPPPDAQTLCTIVTPNGDGSYPEIFGWIDRWNWVQEDRGAPEAPDNWIDRYNTKLFTIKDSDRLTD
jgi:hypothetical protein